MTRMCQWPFLPRLQTSLHPVEEQPLTALTGLTLHKSKNLKTVVLNDNDDENENDNLNVNLHPSSFILHP